MNVHQSAYPHLRKLEGVIAKLEPLSNQNAAVRFLHNADNAETLTEFVQELADAIADYQVRVAGPTVNSADHQARFPYSKECTRGRGKSMMTPRAFTVIPRTS
jgi:hypothetical protein